MVRLQCRLLITVVITLGCLLVYAHLFIYIKTSLFDSDDYFDWLQNRFVSLETKVRALEHRISNDARRIDDIVTGRDDLSTVILVIACNRSDALSEHLDALLSLQTKSTRIPIVVSIDCAHSETRNVVLERGPSITLIENLGQTSFNLSSDKRKYEGYYKIARHYRFALGYVFDVLGYASAIITEDDLTVAPDFLEYMLATKKLLIEDKSLWCISAWNDNGKANLIDKNVSLLHRTDFFPGLGWMITLDLWLELKPKWPTAFWDDWMRERSQRKGRACIRPEISRTGMSLRGKKGVSRGQYYEKHLKHIIQNDQFYSFSKSDLSYLRKENYDQAFISEITLSPSVNVDSVLRGYFSNGTVLPEKVRVIYNNEITFRSYARRFKFMDDFRSGVCRTCYNGVMSFHYERHRVFVIPRLFKLRSNITN